MSVTLPKKSPFGGFHLWHISEIYTDPTGTGEYVPRIGDMVLNWDQGFLRVIDVDITTSISTLVPWSFPTTGGLVDQQDLLLGVKGDTPRDTWRLLVDDSVIPAVMTPDFRIVLYGDTITHYKVFKGQIIEGPSAQVISAWYDNNQNFVSENIPFENVNINDTTNIASKAPKSGYTTTSLLDGEPVTFVAYGNTGRALWIITMLVRKTSFIRKSEASQRYITHISLQSPFLSPTEDRTVNIPINMPVDNFQGRGVVHYSDGSTVEHLLVPNSRMSLDGLSEYLSTIRSQKSPLVLRYMLDVNEATVSAQNVLGTRHIAVPYFIRSTPTVGAYSVKLFVVPHWEGDDTKWRLDYWLYNLERGDYFYATPFVEPGANSRPFRPDLYGVEQKLNVAVDVKRIDPRLKEYRHAQLVGITLMGAGAQDRTPYYIQYAPGQDPQYGGGLIARFNAITPGNWQLRVDCGFLTLESWLDNCYYRSLPLYNHETETAPPRPTHFVVNVNGIAAEYSVDQWNQVLAISEGGTPGRSIFITWIRKAPNMRLELAGTGMMILHTNAPPVLATPPTPVTPPTPNGNNWAPMAIHYQDVRDVVGDSPSFVTYYAIGMHEWVKEATSPDGWVAQPNVALFGDFPPLDYDHPSGQFIYTETDALWVIRCEGREVQVQGPRSAIYLTDLDVSYLAGYSVTELPEWRYDFLLYAVTKKFEYSCTFGGNTYTFEEIGGIAALKGVDYEYRTTTEHNAVPGPANQIYGLEGQELSTFMNTKQLPSYTQILPDASGEYPAANHEVYWYWATRQGNGGDGGGGVQPPTFGVGPRLGFSHPTLRYTPTQLGFPAVGEIMLSSIRIQLIGIGSDGTADKPPTYLAYYPAVPSRNEEF